MTDLTTLKRLQHTMATIRSFEETAARLLASGELPGFLHLSVGQEAVAAGVCDVVEAQDYLTTTHRGHGHCVAKGGVVREMMAELFGAEGGYCGGRSGSMHIADPAKGILGANAIVGACIPIAVGGAFASATLNQGRVAVAFFGEGASAQGVFHESLNIAALWKLPVVFVCENNGYAEMSPMSVHLASSSVAAYAEPHGVPSEVVDGNDVLAVREVAHRGVARARAGDGPTVIEARTYRWRGHFEGDGQGYRTEAEAAAWRERDPLLTLPTRFPEHADALAAVAAAGQEAVAEAAEWARNQPKAGASILTTHIYAEATS